MNKPRTTKHKWIFAAAVTIPDERVNPESPEYGKRTRTSLYGIDSRGLLWRDIDTTTPEFLGRPPAMPPGVGKA